MWAYVTTLHILPFRIIVVSRREGEKEEGETERPLRAICQIWTISDVFINFRLIGLATQLNEPLNPFRKNTEKMPRLFAKCHIQLLDDPFRFTILLVVGGSRSAVIAKTKDYKC